MKRYTGNDMLYAGTGASFMQFRLSGLQGLEAKS